MSRESRPTSVPSGILIHPSVCPQQTWAENWGELGPHVTHCHLGRVLPPYQVVSWSIQLFGHNTWTNIGGAVSPFLGRYFCGIKIVLTSLKYVNWKTLCVLLEFYIVHAQDWLNPYPCTDPFNHPQDSYQVMTKVSAWCVEANTDISSAPPAGVKTYANPPQINRWTTIK